MVPPATLPLARDLTQLRRIERIANIGGWELDLPTRALYWTEQVHRIHGTDPAAFAPTLDSTLDFYAPESRPLLEAAIAAGVAHGQGFDLELELITRSGSRRRVRATCEPEIRDARCVRLAGTLQDVTGQRDAREALRARVSEASKLAAVAENTSDVVIIADAEDRIEWVNRSFTAVTGHTLPDVTEQHAAVEQHQQLLERLQLAIEVGAIATWDRDLVSGKTRWDPLLFSFFGLRATDDAPSQETMAAMVHPDDRPSFDAAWRRLLEVRHAVEFEYRVIRPDGQVVRLNTRGVADRGPDGRAWRALGATIDVTAKEAAQQRLREYDEWLRLAGEATDIGFFQTAIDGSSRRIDRQMKAMFGFDPDGPVPSIEQFDERIVEQDRDTAMTARERAHLTDEPVECEYRIRLPGGSVRHIFTRRLRRCDDQGRPLSVIGTAVDVTNSRRAQAAINEANERLRIATESAGLGLWEWDVTGNAMRIDARVRDILGVDSHWKPDFESRLALVRACDQAQVRRTYEEALQSNVGSSESVYQIVRPSGFVREVLEKFIVLRDEAGNATRLLGTTQDITDIRQTERQRDELYERMQLVADSIGLGIWDWDLLTNTRVWNDQMYALFGTTRADFADRSWTDLVHPDDADRAKAALADAIKSSGRFDNEFRVVTPDDDVRWIASRGRVQRDAVGIAVRVTGVSWDVTERHHAEAAVRDKEAAERASQAKTEFLSRMSHELRTPLNAILGFAQVLDLDRKSALAPLQRDRIGHIQKAGWHLLTLINEILDLSRIESGSTRMSLEDVALAPVIEECATLMTAQAQQRAIRLSVLPASDAPLAVRVDRVRFRQVLLNLLSNAVKYNHDGGSIELAFGAAGPAFASIAVRDSGEGMSAGQLENLFQPFNRLGRERQKIEGTGIGLAISKKLVEQMGGSIEVASEPERGSEFRVLLPRAIGAPPPAQHGAAAEDVRAEITGTVLCVDDNPAHLQVVAGLLLQRPNVRLVTAADGTGALALAMVEQPSLILIDMQLPDCDGYELRERLTMAATTCGIPCVALSANAAAEDIRSALQKGFVEYWTKPVDATRLLAGVDRLLAAADQVREPDHAP